MEYNWNFTEIEVYPTFTKDGVEYNDVVHTVHWSYTASEEEDSQTYIDRLSLDLNNMTEFISYSELTRETVISWVSTSIPNEEISNMQVALAKCITDRQVGTPMESEIRTI
tara:strand:- start:58 stop:390 length:333 start_codon:yes stop_codon:yes gene_type:complete